MIDSIRQDRENKLNRQTPLYTGKVRSVTRIGKYYYGFSMDSYGLYVICIQQIGDIGWLIVDDEYTSLMALLDRIEFIEKEHYAAATKRT